MTNTEKFFLSLISNYVNGTPLASYDFDGAELLKLSQMHKLSLIILSVIKKENVPLKEEELCKFKLYARSDAVGITYHKIYFESFLKDLTESGFSPILFKGAYLSEFYPEKDVRLSSDEDMLFTKEELDGARAIFEKHGLERFDNNDDDTVFGYKNHTSGLYIEAHTRLFPLYPSINEKMNALFENARENSSVEPVGGASCRVLSPTDHLLFLILHSFKHFIYCGFGIRQIMDFIIFAKAKKGRIDCDRVIWSLKKVKADGFFDGLLGICKNYFGASPEDMGFVGYTPEEYDVSDLLADVLSGGAYGNITKERLHSSKMTLSASEGVKVSALTSLFPHANALKRDYPFLISKPWLLPVAWSLRILKHLKKNISEREFDAAETIEIGKERLAMMKKYGVTK